MTPILQVQSLSKVFRMHVLNGKNIRALDNITFDMAEGEVLCLAGSSGSGKSTLMKCIYRTYLPTCGQILFRERSGSLLDLAACDEHAVLQARGREMTYCSQFLQVIPRIAAADVVAEPRIRRGVEGADAMRQALRLLERLAMPRELWDAFPSTFSGGEQQRINIARALMAKPRFLLVDEPTASLDLATKNAVIDLLLELREEGASIVLITHDAHTRTRMADRCLEMEMGRVREGVSAPRLER
jgi:alpha-D-ribose 1-methylphosphonate 5-triphosphate synthase subunit PhnL